MASITESGRKYSARDERRWGRFAILTAGLVCLALGAFLIAALTSHDPGDPSWNQSINGTAKNLMGLPGARVSDLLLQWLGFAAWLLPLVLIDWAVRCIGGRGLKRFWLKLAVLPPLLLAAPLAISIVPPPAGWPLKVGVGGVIGKLGRDGFAHISIAPPLAAMAAALVVALMLLYLMGLSALSFMPRAAADKKRYVRPQNRRAIEEDDDEDEDDFDEDAAGKPGLIARARGLLPTLSLPWKRGGDDDGVLTRERREPSLGGIVGGDDADEEVEDIKLPPVRRSVSVDMPKKAKKREAQRQALLDLGPSGEHLLPSLELLDEVAPSRFAQISEEALQQNARLLESVLADYGIQRPDREGAARPGRHALRARARARHQGLAHHRPRRRYRALDERDLGARRRRARPQRHRHRAALDPRRDGLSARAAWPRRIYERSNAQADAGARQGYRRHAGDRRSRAHAASAHRRHDRLGQIGRHQHDDPLDPLSDVARSVQIHHDRSEDARALGL